MSLNFMEREGRLFWSELKGAWWLSTPHFVPDGTHDQMGGTYTLSILNILTIDKGADADDYCYR